MESATTGHILAAGISVDQPCEGRRPTSQSYFADGSPGNVIGLTQQAEGVVIGIQLVPCRSCDSEMPSVYVTSVVVNIAPGAYRESDLGGRRAKLSRNADGAASFSNTQLRVTHGNQNQLIMLDQWDVFRRQPSLPQSQTPAVSSYTADELRILHRIIML